MNPQEIRIPAWVNARILSNSLYGSKEPPFLTCDLVFVALPDGYFIDAGWYPERDPSGCYRICVYKEDWEKQFKCEYVNEPSEVVSRVVNLAMQFAPRQSTQTAEVEWGGFPAKGVLYKSSTGKVQKVRYA